MKNFILASASPRRVELLHQMGVQNFDIIPANIDETPLKCEEPRDYVRRIARAKAEHIAQSQQLPILSADTIVVKGRQILGKPTTPEDAKNMLQKLSGCRHRVYSAVVLWVGDNKYKLRLVETRVKFARLSDKDIENYIASNEWQGKAGGYAIQGLAGAFVEWVNGSYSNIVGLPLRETRNLLLSEQLIIQ